MGTGGKGMGISLRKKEPGIMKGVSIEGKQTKC